MTFERTSKEYKMGINRVPDAVYRRIYNAWTYGYHCDLDKSSYRMGATIYKMFYKVRSTW